MSPLTGLVLVIFSSLSWCLYLCILTVQILVLCCNSPVLLFSFIVMKLSKYCKGFVDILEGKHFVLWVIFNFDMSACCSEKAPSWLAHQASTKTSHPTSPLAQSDPGHCVGPRLNVGFHSFRELFTQWVVPSFKGNFYIVAWPGWCSSPPCLPDPSVVFHTAFRFHAERAIDIITHILPEDHLLLASSKRVKGMDLTDWLKLL